jgi:hypothetical protein
MAHREGEASTHRFRRYLHSQSPEGSPLREQIVPNRILLSDHATPVPAHQRKQRKFPLFAMKTSPKRQLPEGNIFTNRGIVPSGAVFEGEGRNSLGRLLLKSQRKRTETSLTLFNKLILTPFNFVRPNNPAHSASSLRDRRMQTPKSKPKSADRTSRSRPSCHRTLEEWSRGRRE